MQQELAFAFAAAAALNCVVAVMAWRRRATAPVATVLAAAGASMAWWTLTSIPSQTGLSARVRDVAVHGSFVGVLGVVVSLYLVSCVLVNPHARSSRREQALLAAGTLPILAVVVTDPWHHQFLISISSDGRREFGPLFWVHTAWCYGLLTVAGVRMVRAWWAGSATVRRQVGAALLGAAVPIAGNAVVLMRPDLFDGQDITPLFFTVPAVVIARAILSGGLLRVVPIARAAVLDTVPDVVVVIDAGGTVVDVNPAGRAYLLALHPEAPVDPVGLPASSFLLPRALGDLPEGHLRYAMEHAPGLHLDVNVNVIHTARGRPLGRVVVARDVTDIVQAHRRLEEQVELIERLRAQLQEDSVRDPLTGLHNRRFLGPALATALERARCDGTTLGVLALDIDHFKRVNDSCGHAAGDAVLVAVARALQAHADAQDIVARTGGEEFVVIVPETSAAGIAVQAELLRAVCARLAVDVANGALPVRATVSVGTVLYAGDARTGAQLLAEADHALYAAKNTGRDRVVAA